MTNKSTLAIGLMSGTSMDGIDAAIIATDGDSRAVHIGGYTSPYSSEFKMLLRDAEQLVQHKGPTAVEALQALIYQLTMLHAETIEHLLKQRNIPRSEIAVIGFHGQTLCHRPELGITLQIGDGALLAQTSSITTVNNFRAKDVAHGGQGAPFAPLYHQVLLGQAGIALPAAVVNCGGIANISLVSTDSVAGFDVGPGNVLIDRYIRQHTNGKESMDRDGIYGSQGSVDTLMLEILRQKAISCNYLDIAPPKSLDSGDLVLPAELSRLNLFDAISTLEAFTAKCIADNLESYAPQTRTAVLVGGGANNPMIIRFLRQFSPDLEWKTAQELGWKNSYIEAELFAYMAVRSLQGKPISYPGITGVPKPLTGGDIWTKN